MDERTKKTDEEVEGKVTKVTNFGAFLELEQDLEGLLHISELKESEKGKPEEEGN